MPYLLCPFVDHPPKTRFWPTLHKFHLLISICSASLSMVEYSAPTQQRCWVRTVCWPAFSTTTGQIPVVATSSFHKNMAVSNGPKHLELQGIKRYSVSVRPPTLPHLTYPSARQKLSCRLDPVCGLQVGWSLVLCSSNTAVPITQHHGEEKVEGKVRLFGEAQNLWPFISCTIGGCITHFII